MRIERLSSLIGLVALAACAPTEVRVRSNAVFADDGQSIVIAETRYLTHQPEQPWFYAPEATGWQVSFLTAAPDLSNVTPGPVFDETYAQGGGIQSALIHFVASRRTVVATEYHQAVAYDFDARVRRLYALPEDEKARLFVTGAGDLRPLMEPVATVPSPSGAVVAVFYTSTFEGPGGMFDLRYVHAIGFFELGGAFLRAVALSPWDGTEEDLMLDQPVPEPMLPQLQPPDFAGLGSVAASNPGRLIWSSDSAAVFVVDRDVNDAGVASGLAWRIEVSTGAAASVAEVPERAVPTLSGPVSDDGRMLVVRRSRAAPNDDSLELYATTNWKPFAQLERVPVAEATYAR